MWVSLYSVFPTGQSISLESGHGQTTFCHPVPSSSQIARRFQVQESRTPQSPTLILIPVISYIGQDMNFKTKRQGLKLHKIARPISTSSLTWIWAVGHCRSQEATRRTTQDTRNWTAVMLRDTSISSIGPRSGILSIPRTVLISNCANIKIPNGFMRCGILKCNWHTG